MKLITAFGETKSLKEWSEDSRCKVRYKLLNFRLSKKWSLEEALTRPLEDSKFRIKMKIGDKKNRLILLETFKKNDQGIDCTYGKFKCICNKIIESKVSNVHRGHTKSCGCLGIEKLIKRSYKHGLSKSKLMRTLKGMIERCHNYKHHHYSSYGERGIKVCDEWRNNNSLFFEWSKNNGFIDSSDISIDRLDENDDYKPENCRWTDQEGQNESRQNNKIIIAWGEMNSLIRWMKDPRVGRNVDIEIVKYRLKLGWSTEDSLSKIAYLG